jgi:erythromycin esterase-like protein
MRKIISIFIAFILVCIARGQDQIKEYVSQSAISISSIEPDSTNYSDLEVIGKAIGNASIVMLGEQDHGDAPTFLAKTRLIKYLHEKKGFNVLAFESDFFGLNYGWDKINKTKGIVDTFLRYNIFPIWTYCYTCNDLFYNYIPSTYKTENPLTITGFDNQMVLSYSAKNISSYLDSVFRKLNLPITKELNYDSEILPLIDSLKYWSFKDTFNYTKCGSYLIECKNQLKQKKNNNDFEMMVIENLIQSNEEYKYNKIDFRYSSNVRDKQMAENLKWLKNNKFQSDKIIVWAANAHVAKYEDSSRKNKLVAMGSFFTKDSILLRDTYIIGFTSYRGEAGRLSTKKYTVRKPEPNGFENWINKSYEFSFVSFKKYREEFPGSNETFYLKGLGHYSAFRKDWTKVFDGVFFIRNMYACEK